MLIISPDQSLPSDIPSTVSLRVLFRRYVDFLAVPRRSFFHMLRYFTTSDVEAERLDEFLSHESAVRTIASSISTDAYKVPRTNFTTIASKSVGRFWRF